MVIGLYTHLLVIGIVGIAVEVKLDGRIVGKSLARRQGHVDFMDGIVVACA